MSKAQLDFLETLTPAQESGYVFKRPDPERIRRKLERILAEAKAADTIPWDPKQHGFYATVFPQMTNWLPEGAAARYRLEFANEMERLGGAAS